MAKGQLITRKEGYPFVYFPEKAFHKEQVVSLISRAYQLELEKGVTTVVQPHNMAMKDTFLLTLGKVGRIVHLGENHSDLFFDDSFNDEIRAMAEVYNNDLIKVTNELLSMGLRLGADKEAMDIFEADIKMVYDSENMFYMDSSIPYSSLEYLAKDSEESPFCEKNICKFLRNIPIVRVW